MTALIAPKIAEEPAEERGLTRDTVRLLVATRHDDALVDAVFRDIPDFVAAGDLLVVNTSATVPAAVPTADGRLVHFSTELPGGLWVVEVREPCGAGSIPYRDASDGETVSLADGGSVQLLSPYPVEGPPRLWVARPRVFGNVLDHLARHGRPIRYGCTERSFPLDAYQTVFGEEPGSAEMPSASRGFTPEVVARLVNKGVGITPITLHTGVSSLEAVGGQDLLDRSYAAALDLGYRWHEFGDLHLILP